MPIHRTLKSFPLYRVIASFPLVTFAILLLISQRVFPRFRFTEQAGRILATAATVLFGGIVLAYLFLPLISDESEAQIMSAGYRVLFHSPIYQPLDSAQQYSVLYGPLAFLVLTPFFQLFGASLFSAKLPGVLACFLGFTAIFRIVRYWASASEAWIVLGCVCLFALKYGFFLFWVHPDPLLFAVTSLSLWAILRKPSVIAVACTGIGLAMAVNLKATALLYYLPCFTFLWIRKGWRAFVLAGCIAAVLIPVPYLLPSVSLTDYLTVLRVASHHGLDADLISRDFQYAALIMAPFLALVVYGHKRWIHVTSEFRLYMWSLAISLTVVCVIAAKPGSGPHHVLPFLGQGVLAYFWYRSESQELAPNTPFQRIALPWVATLCFYIVGGSIGNAVYVKVFRSLPQSRQVLLDIADLRARYPQQTVEMGYGEAREESRVSFRALLAFANNPYTIDRNAQNDLQFGGVPLADATVRYVERCGTAIWLIPKGEQPFYSPNAYEESLRIYEGPFRKAFLGHYHKAETLRQFDVWQCNAR